jgi:hypothetical protein
MTRDINIKKERRRGMRKMLVIIIVVFLTCCDDELLLGDEHYINGTWGFGAKDSPIRNYLIDHVALTLEDHNTAAQALEAALNSSSFAGVRQYHEESLASAKAHATGL